MPRISADLRALRAMSHPLRLRIVEVLTEASRPMRPTDLAQQLGEAGNVVRYHVATLREAGVLVEVDGPQGADGREHWYRMAPHTAEGAEADDTDAATAAAFTRAMSAVHARHTEASRAAEVAGVGPRVHLDGTAWLLAEDAERIVQRITALREDIMASWRSAAEAGDSEEVVAHRYGFLVDLYPDTLAGAPVSAAGEAIPLPPRTTGSGGSGRP